MIDRAICRTVGFFRYQCGLRLSPAWELDDVRQSAAMHFLATGDYKAAMHATWAEFRRNRYTINRYRPGLPDEIESHDERHEPISESLLSKCSDRERAAICLAYECDMSCPEIAESLGCSTTAAKLLLLRGRGKVRKAIAS